METEKNDSMLSHNLRIISKQTPNNFKANYTVMCIWWKHTYMGSLIDRCLLLRLVSLSKIKLSPFLDSMKPAERQFQLVQVYEMMASFAADIRRNTDWTSTVVRVPINCRRCVLCVWSATSMVVSEVPTSSSKYQSQWQWTGVEIYLECLWLQFLLHWWFGAVSNM